MFFLGLIHIVLSNAFQKKKKKTYKNFKCLPLPLQLSSARWCAGPWQYPCTCTLPAKERQTWKMLTSLYHLNLLFSNIIEFISEYLNIRYFCSFSKFIWSLFWVNVHIKSKLFVFSPLLSAALCHLITTVFVKQPQVWLGLLIRYRRQKK